MQRSTLKKTRPLIAVASALALALAGCGGSGDDASDDKPAAATESQDPSTTSEDPEDGADTSDEPETTAEDDESGEDDAGEDESGEDEGADSLPSKVVEAGTVKPGATRTASGKEDSLVTFEQSDSFAVVAEFDCKECKGDIEIQQLGSHSPLESGEDDAGEDESGEDEGADSLPSKVVEAGTVKPGATRTASGKEDSLVTFEQSDSFAVVAEFDCKECKGDIEIQQLGSHSPLDSGEKSLSGSYLLDLIGGPDEEQTLIVRADGEWNVKLRSWNDLPIASGTQEGKGSKVIYIGDSASAVEVTYKPPKGGGNLNVTVTSAVEKDGDFPKTATISGGKKFTKKKEIKLPGVLTIQGKGSWTVKLVS